MTPPPASAPPVLLQDQLCLALYLASRSMSARYRPALAGTGLTYPQYLVMLMLWEHGPSTVSQIGAELVLESSTLSPLLKRLEALDMVTRVRSTDDERTVVVSMTTKGKALRRRSPGIHRQLCEATGMEADQRSALISELRLLADRLGASD